MFVNIYTRMLQVNDYWESIIHVYGLQKKTFFSRAQQYINYLHAMT